MDLYDAQQLANELMQKHLTNDDGTMSWSFRWDRAKTRAGCCSWKNRAIQLSMPQTKLHTEDVVRDTILHEIAHALAGARHGHDAHWRSICRQVGAIPQRCLTSHNEAGEKIEAVEAPWQGSCVLGHQRQNYHRAPQRVTSCGQCAKHAYGHVKFDISFIVIWTHKGRTVELKDMPAKYQREYEIIMIRRARY